MTLQRIKEIAYDKTSKLFVVRGNDGKKIDVPLGSSGVGDSITVEATNVAIDGTNIAFEAVHSLLPKVGDSLSWVIGAPTRVDVEKEGVYDLMLQVYSFSNPDAADVAIYPIVRNPAGVATGIGDQFGAVVGFKSQYNGLSFQSMIPGLTLVEGQSFGAYGYPVASNGSQPSDAAYNIILRAVRRA